MIPKNTKSIISIVLEIRSNELPNRKRYTNISGDKYAYKSKSNCKLTECPRMRQTPIKAHIMDFHESWVVWPTHGWDWPPTIFLVWDYPCGQGSPTPGLILLVTSKFFLTAPRGLAKIFCYILVKSLMENFEYWPRAAIFWRGPSLKKFSGILAF